MKRCVCAGLLPAVAFTFFVYRLASTDDIEKESVGVNQIAAGARKAIRKIAGDAMMDAVEKQTRDHVVVYEVEWEAEGSKHEVVVTAGGVLVETVRSLAPEAVPEDVSNAVARHLPTGVSVTFERKQTFQYEAEAKIEGKEVELLVSPTGRVLKGDDDGDDDDGDDDDGDDDDGDDDDGDDD